jgi:hypothetical protein
MAANLDQIPPEGFKLEDGPAIAVERYIGTLTPHERSDTGDSEWAGIVSEDLKRCRKLRWGSIPGIFIIECFNNRAGEGDTAQQGLSGSEVLPVPSDPDVLSNPSIPTVSSGPSTPAPLPRTSGLDTLPGPLAVQPGEAFRNG